MRDLQLAHLYAVPFENLSIHWEQPINLNDEALYDKVVVRGRGGFCYELNGLFAWLLRALGFNVKKLAAGVAKDGGSYSPYFDHMALLVTLDHPWLVDVGFGDTFREPLRLDLRTAQKQAGGDYRIGREDDIYILEERKDGQDWESAYRFTLQPHEYSDYLARCHYHQTSLESHFKQRRVCSRATPTGRITLSETALITTALHGPRQEQAVANEELYERLLEEHFGISVRA